MTRIDASKWSWILAGVALGVAVLLIVPTMLLMHANAGLSYGSLFVPLLVNALIGLVMVLAVALVVGQGVLERRPGLMVRSPGVLIGCFFVCYLVVAGVISYAWGWLTAISVAHAGSLFSSMRDWQWMFAMTRWLPTILSFWLALRLTLLLCRLPADASTTQPSADTRHRGHASVIFSTVFLACSITVMQAALIWQFRVPGDGWVLGVAVAAALAFTCSAWLGAWIGLKYQRGDRVRPGLLALAALGTWLAPAILLAGLAVIVFFLFYGSGDLDTSLLVGMGLLALVLLLLSPFFLAWGLTRLVWRRAWVQPAAVEK